ncbi:MAG: universal stress protein [Rhodobacteraceae bacterium]|nr:universal stress protein [Paracoccaceae bacterium]
MPKSVLLSVDLADTSLNLPVLEAAIGLLEEGGTLHVISVLPDFGMAIVGGFFSADHEKAALKRLGEQLRAWVDEHVPDTVEVRPHVLHGSIYDEILRAADKLKADVIVMGAHRPDLKDYLLGPNAARVVRHARQSVYVVRA